MDRVDHLIKKLDAFEETLLSLSDGVKFLKKDNKKIREDLRDCKYHREKLYEELVTRYETLKDERS